MLELKYKLVKGEGVGKDFLKMALSTTQSSPGSAKNSINHKEKEQRLQYWWGPSYSNIYSLPQNNTRLVGYRDGRMYHCPWSRGPGKARDGVMMLSVARPGGSSAQASSGQPGLASRWTATYPYNSYVQWHPTSLAVATGE